MIRFQQKGDFKRTEQYLKRVNHLDLLRILEKYGQEGVKALSSATPVDSGETAQSWGYEIKKERTSFTITWTNTHLDGGVPVALLIQLGHGTGTGGYVQGRDYINPALKPIFDKIAQEAWREVTRT